MKAMDNFNLVEELLGKAESFQGKYREKHYIFALKGDTNKMATGSARIDGLWVTNPTYEQLVRQKRESYLMTSAKVLVFTYSEHEVKAEWNSLYRNKKGLYWKRHGKKFYLSKP